MTLRVVLDTNIIVSALLQPLGMPAQVFSLAATNVVRMCVTDAIFSEYDEVIRRPRFKRSLKEIDAALQTIRANSVWVTPGLKVAVCSDPDDDMLLERAQAAEAHHLITGNLRHFPNVWHGARIVTARQFPEIVA
jgi:uncharacterized protein